MFEFFPLLISNRREKEFKRIGHAFQQFGKTLGNMKLDHMNTTLIESSPIKLKKILVVLKFSKILKEDFKFSPTFSCMLLAKLVHFGNSTVKLSENRKSHQMKFRAIVSQTEQLKSK